MKLPIKKGDIVKIIAGDNKGHQGRVLNVFPDKQKVIVEGANFIRKHTRPTQKNQKGGIVKKEAPIHISNVMLIDPTTGQPTRIGRKYDEKPGKLVRYSKKTGAIIK